MPTPITPNELARLFPGASKACVAANLGGIRADHPQPAKGNSLVSSAPRKDKSGDGPVERFKIIFRVYSVRPADYDAYSCKELQDMLVHATILPDDNWRILQGETISCKAYSKEEERTEVEIYEPEAY